MLAAVPDHRSRRPLARVLESLEAGTPLARRAREVFAGLPEASETDARGFDPLQRLRTLWRDKLSERPAFEPYHNEIRQPLGDPQGIAVREIGGAQAARRIENTLSRAEHELILLGDPADLHRHPLLYELSYSGSLTGSFAVCFAPSGELVLFWMVPEG